MTERIVRRIAANEAELVELASALVGFDTTTRSEDHEPAREEAALQRFLADRLASMGAEIDLWEPEPASLPEAPQIPQGATFAGRPQLIARFPGRGYGKSVVLNGHIDVVSAEPRGLWGSDPFTAVVEGRRLIGRGTCDMKGGIAAMVMAMAALQAEGIELAGDVLINTVTDEEINGAGTVASLARGLQADYGIVPEPSDLRLCTSNRGIVAGRITFTGRPGHADIPQPHWRDGGAVNAIEMAVPAIAALQDLRGRWIEQHDPGSPLPAGNIVPTTIKGGEWVVSYPSDCSFEVDVTYHPDQADSQGAGSGIRQQIEQAVLGSAPDPGWEAQHPTDFTWYTDLPPVALPENHPLVEALVQVAGELDLDPGTVAHPSWTDAASLTHAGIPSMVIGPTATRPDGSATLHTIDEYVDIDDLLATAQILALAIVRLTGS
ncbi:M20 family metallopeptidase [Paeniglutamicibacter cryotolerans]|uniref:Acetylornithine deacetylase n=1 Tax=Paeniglutamicibacter cryotolerans TaxID=670079 RepID=A0A839QP35_9MICC|nr:ArgE/DapE family deacylase [Paeniglutamicibacter cryotolerans]MBB2995756.1 acetylornithine deacetylase [Paeniglutamicibacter cryotolerans]